METNNGGAQPENKVQKITKKLNEMSLPQLVTAAETKFVELFKCIHGKDGARIFAIEKFHFQKMITENEKLKEGKDKEKDQSYFLWTLTQDDLLHTLFPVGHLEKSEVRKLAKKFDIPVSEKKDSQGICFLGDVNLEDFLSHFIKTSPGKVLNTKGEVIGQHNGALYYTLGERHGFEVTQKGTNSKPFYVIAKDINENTISVSNDAAEITSHSPKEIRMEKVNWITESPRRHLGARIRYRQKKFKVSLEGNKVIFDEPQTAASGQSIVFYSPADSGEGDEEICLGGGIIA